MYFDCSGFEDTCEITKEIINAFYVNKIFETTK